MPETLLREFSQLYSSAGTEVNISPYFMLRVAGLPRSCLDTLQFRDTMAIVDRLLHVEDWLSRHRQALAGYLFRAAYETKDANCRVDLVRLKRDVFNFRTLAPAPLAVGTRTLHGRHRRLLVKWATKILLLARLRDEGAHVFDRELEQKRGALARLLSEPKCQLVLLSSNCDLAAVLSGRPEQFERLRTRARRQAETTAAAYISRAAMRPTPLGHCAAVGWGIWSAGSECRARTTHGRHRSQIRLNQAILNVIAARAAAHPDIRPYVPLRMNPTAIIGAHKVTWIATSPPALNVHGVAKGVTQRSCSLARSALVDSIITLVRAGELSGDEIVSQPPHRMTVEQLTDLQLFERRILVPDLCADPLVALEIKLASILCPAAQRIRLALGRIRCAMERYAAGDLQERFEAVAEIRWQLGGLDSLLSLDTARVRRLVYEDVAVDFEELKLPGASVRDARRALTLWHRVVSLFDGAIVQKVAARCAFEEMYGAAARVPVAEFFQQYLHHFKESLPIALTGEAAVSESHVPWKIGGFTEQPHRSPEIASLEAWQAKFIEWWINSVGAQDDEVVIDENELDVWLSKAPAVGPMAPSIAVLCQLTRGETGWRFVLDYELPGFGKCFSRFCRLLAEGAIGAGTSPMEALISERETICPAGTILADLGGVFGFNGNLRIQQTPCLIEFPGTVPCTARYDTIKMSDLVVRLDRDRRRLVFELAANGREVWPLDLGTMTFSRQPSLYQFMTLTSPPGSLPWLPIRRAPAPASGVRRWPRIRLGNVIVRRARWICDRDTAVAVNENERGFPYLVAVHRWLREHKVPARMLGLYGGA